MERSAVSPIVLVTEVGAASVVTGTCAAVLRCTLVTLTTHGLGVAVCRLVTTTHTLPLP